MLASVLTLALAAEPVSLAVSRIPAFGYFEVGEARLVDAVMESLRASGVAVVSPGQALQRLGSDRKGELFACVAEDDGCVQALGAALEVEGVLVGSLIRDGSGRIQLRLEVRSSRDARALATYFETGIDAAGLPQAAAAGARLLAADLQTRGAEALARAPAVHAWSTSPLLRKVAWTGLAISGTALTVGTVCILHREARYQEVERLNDQRPKQPRVDYLGSEDARSLFAVAVSTFITSGVALAAYGLFWWLGTSPTPVVLTLAPLPGGAAVGLVAGF